MDANSSLNALAALQQKFPNGTPDICSMNEEQKAWIQMKVQDLAAGVVLPKAVLRLQKIRGRLVHATEDIPDRELQEMVSFVFNNMNEIENLLS